MAKTSRARRVTGVLADATGRSDEELRVALTVAAVAAGLFAVLRRTAPIVEHPGRNASAGLLFVNDEGTECGGLQYAGYQGSEGKEQMGYLTVDDYEQNESLRLGMFQNGDASQRFIEFTDQPAWSIVDMIEETEGLDSQDAQAIYDRYFDGGDGRGRSRMRLAREEDGSVGLVLRDCEGHDRLRLIVPAEGDAIVEVVDSQGNARSLL